MNRGYNTFDNDYIDNRISDDGGFVYESSYALNELMDKHPTQSHFSLNSMRYDHHLGLLDKALSHRSMDKIYSHCGQCYRKCCFTANGMKLMLSVNIMLLLLNLFLIVYEVILILESGAFDKYFRNTHLPDVFFICDLLITFILIVEVLLHWSIGYMCSCREYIGNSTWDNKVDVIVMTLSILCCILYITDYYGSADILDVDNMMFLIIRVIRDAIRITRCIFFFRLLQENLASTFDGIVECDAPITDLKKIHTLKRNKSQRLWDQFVKEREQHPTVTMLGVTPIAEEEETEPVVI